MSRRPRKVTDEREVDNVIDKWHEGSDDNERLHDALGWTWEEYRAWVEKGVIPSE